MYLCHATKRTKDGARTFLTPVRSVRRGSKVVQEIVANLGRLDARELREAAAISRHFLGPKPTSRLACPVILRTGADNAYRSRTRADNATSPCQPNVGFPS